MLGRARGAKHLALPRLDHALEHLTALTRLRVGDADVGRLKTSFGVELGVGIRQPQRRLRDEPESAPLEVRAQREHLGHHLQRLQVAVRRNDPLVLVLDLATPVVQLAQDHQDRLQDVERLEAGDHDRPAVVVGNEVKRPRPDDRAHVARANESVEPQVRRFQQRP